MIKAMLGSFQRRRFFSVISIIWFRLREFMYSRIRNTQLGVKWVDGPYSL
jgi:hypothetical protein